MFEENDEQLQTLISQDDFFACAGQTTVGDVEFPLSEAIANNWLRGHFTPPPTCPYVPSGYQKLRTK